MTDEDLEANHRAPQRASSRVIQRSFHSPALRYRSNPGTNPLRLAALAALAALAPAFGTAARADAPVALTEQALSSREGLALVRGWRYQPRDDPSWASPGLDDGAWDAVEGTGLDPSALPPSGWPGIGWFRLHVAVPPELAGRSLALQVRHLGASEIYVDGAPVARFGTVAATPAAEDEYYPQALPVIFAFDRPGEHVVAVRYSCAKTGGQTAFGALLRRAGMNYGFTMKVGLANPIVEGYASSRLSDAMVVIPLVAILLTLALLHGLLYAFYREQKANLYYALFAVGFAGVVGGGWDAFKGHGGAATMLAGYYVNRVGLVLCFLGFLRFLYAAFDFPVPRLYRWLAWAWVAAMLYVVVPFGGVQVGVPVLICISVSIAVAMTTMGRAIGRKVDGARIIGAGVCCFVAGLTAQLVNESFGLNSGALELAGVAVLLGFPLCVSLYLARGVATVNRGLKEKLVEVETLSSRALEHERLEASLALEREQDRARTLEAELRAESAELQAKAAEAQAQALEAEHRRKTLELEEARELQLSMLPRRPPEVPGLAIAAWMRTATEVGGDYYDFHRGADGALTVAVGDATGHGLKAGTLVAAVKGLFGTLAETADGRDIFHEISRSLKRMRLGRLYMALSVARFRGREVTISAAGMPPALVYRAATGEVEPVALTGMWLGAVAGFPYDLRTVALGPGDVVLLMSDGFPEMFDERREMLGYDRAAEIFREVAGGSPEEVVDRLRREGERWAGARPQDDDVTFVAIKVEGAGEAVTVLSGV